MTDQPSTAHPDAQKARSLVRQALRCLDRGQQDAARALADVAHVYARLAADATASNPDPVEHEATPWMPTQTIPTQAKGPTAEEKITLVLHEERDPLGLEVGYLHLDQITARTEVTRKTIENTLSRLVKDRRVVRNPQASGEYGLPLPENNTPDSP